MARPDSEIVSGQRVDDVGLAERVYDDGRRGPGQRVRDRR
jgi:hypothetical protein